MKTRSRFRLTETIVILSTAILLILAGSTGTLSAATINVPVGEIDQTLIDNATAGDVLQFAAGVYVLTEPLLINKQLTLLGVGATSIIRPNYQDLANGEYDIKIMASGTIIQDLFLDFNYEGDDRALCCFPCAGIVVSDMDQPAVNNVAITGNRIEAPMESQAIQTGLNSDVGGLAITYNEFIGDPGGVGSQLIYINPFPVGGTVSITHNSFSGMLYDAIVIEASNVQAIHNDIESTLGLGTNSGIRVVDWYDTAVHHQGIEINNNWIENMTHGIRFSASDALKQAEYTADVLFNMLTGNDIGLRAGPFTTVHAAISNNFFEGNTTLGLQNQSDSALDATNNWWGDPSGPTHADNPTGIGEAIDDTGGASAVTYDPWITGAASQELAADGTVLDGNVGMAVTVDITNPAGDPALIIMMRYDENPTGIAFDGTFLDLRIPDVSNITSIALKLYYDIGESRRAPYWFNDATDEWEAIENFTNVVGAVTVEGVTYGGYLLVTINAATSPSLNDLTGTVFGIGEKESDDSGLCFISSLFD